MEEPTEGQWQELLEWCGFEEIQYMGTDNKPMPGCVHWVHPGAVGGGCSTLPKIDLNNLFVFAVPKYIDEIKAGASANYTSNAYVRLFERWHNNLVFANWENPALALFWVIHKVIEPTKHRGE